MHRKPAILVGVDFDNTIISYDALFLETALAHGLVPSGMPADKNEIRDFLRDKDMEDRWTLLQGEVYGRRSSDAVAFPGVKAFFRSCLTGGIGVCIVSHKTKTPYLGPQYDLHQAAYKWLEKEGFFNPGVVGIDRNCVYFELTKAKKISRIARLGCTHYIDDLPEILIDERFPDQVRKLLFNISGAPESSKYRRFASWSEISAHFACMGHSATHAD
jgi:hypothetical protein